MKNKRLTTLEIYYKSGLITNLMCFMLLVGVMILTIIFTESFIRVALFTMVALCNSIFLIYTLEAFCYARELIKSRKVIDEQFNNYLIWQKDHPDLDKEWYIENILKKLGR